MARKRPQIELFDVSHGRATRHYASRFEVPAAPGIPARRHLPNPQLASGQGLTAREARRKARAEAIERYSMVFQGNEEHFLAPFEDIAGDAVSPLTLGQYSEAQYAARGDGETFPRIPIPYRNDLPALWCPAWSFTHDRVRFLPLQYCYMACTPEELPMYLACDSNGCAAGASDEEAITRGFLELVERDAVAVWWYNRISPPRVAFEAGPEIAALLKANGASGRHCELVDLTTDLAVPVYGALSWDAAGRNIGMGFGAHFDASRALRRALLEALQTADGIETADPHAKPAHTLEGAHLRWAKSANAAHLPHFATRGERELPAFEEQGANDAALASQCLEVTRRAGLELLALRLTRPETRLKVVRVAVPGLRHPWKRLAPGRLYDVPVRMGWTDRPLREGEMNPDGYAL